jgi:hypothetical protein
LFDVDYGSEFEIYTAELQQVFESDRHLTLLGGRCQTGTFETQDRLTLVNTNFAPFFLNPPAQGDFKEPFERFSAYAYHTWEVVPRLRLTAGVAYDHVEYPVNYRYPPTSPGATEQDQVSPKAALVWAPNETVAVRAAYTRSLGGASFDESFRLEPTQLAGFSQAFRTLIPESVVGSVTAPRYETAGLALDLKFPTRTYAGLQADFLQSEVDRDVGVFQFTGTVPVTPSTTREELEYTEPSVSLTLNQLISEEWSVGAQYRFILSQLDRAFPEVSGANQDLEANLHQARLFALLNLPCGFFAEAEALYYNQSNRGYSPDIPGDEFFQFNAFVGYRLKRQRGELTLGVLNIGDTDYNLNPLNPYAELLRERVLAVRLKFNL